jgi:NAD(P)-dependent dehydrogenase (short-subunit alcohol dehydrogenase family)
MFQGKTVIVTGAAGNVGSALAQVLAEQGARVAAVDMVRERLDAVVAALPGSGHLSLSTYNLLDPASAEALVAHVVAQCGALHGVGTTVGGFAMGKIADAGQDQWDLMFNLNVRTTWNIYRSAVPAIRAAGGGALCAIGSAAGLRGSGEMAAYSATKSAVMRLTESLGAELHADRIRANAVLPTTIDTPQNRAAMPDADASRWVKPRQVGQVMAFLLSDAASAVTGQLLQVGS